MFGRQEIAFALLAACVGCSGLACGATQASSADFTDIAMHDTTAEAPSASARVAPRAAAPPSRVSPVAWRKDADAAASDADKSGKPLLVYLRADWCVACLELERAWQSDAAFERASRSFVPLWLDATDDGALAEVSARFGALPVPSVALIDRKTGRRSLLDSRASLDRAADSVVAFISEDSE